MDVNSTNAAVPYANWQTAASNIQDAIDATTAGDTVLVTNGVYARGGRVARGTVTNRVAVTRPIIVQSVNGPEVTMIKGFQVAQTGHGQAAVRCAYLTNGAALIGFTLTNGATRYDGSTRFEPFPMRADGEGGGIWCESISAVVSNCVAVSNLTAFAGGGIFGGTLYDCVVAENTVLDTFGFGGGASSSTLIDCIVARNWAWYGGGVGHCTGTNCTITANTGHNLGGGAYGSALYYCAIVSNFCNGGGGACAGELNNCLLAHNTASWGGGAAAGTLNNCVITSNSPGGTIDGLLNNCIIYYNNPPDYPNWVDDFETPFAMNFCCTVPLPPEGVGNFTNAPLFMDAGAGNYRLLSNSPCINAGNNSYATVNVDWDGNPRVSGGTVDVGAFEFQNPGSMISYAWLQSYGLPSDGSADSSDTDSDGMNNWQEWIAGTVPTDMLSVLRLFPETPGSVDRATVNWQSVSGKIYYVERSTNLNGQPMFSTIESNLVGQFGVMSYTDTNVAGQRPFFYRVGVKAP